MADSPLLLNLLIAFGACQAFFISGIMISQRPKQLPQHFFLWFLIIEGTTLVERLLVESNFIDGFPHILGISYPLSFIKAPLLFFTALGLVNQHFRLRRIHALHLILFVIFFAINIPFYLLSGPQKVEQVREFMAYVPGYTSFEFYLYLSFFVNIGLYIGAAIKRLQRFRQQVKNNALVNAYLQVLQLYIGFLLIHLLHFVLQPTGWLEIPLFNSISMLLMTFIIQAIAYKFIAASDIFRARATPDLSNLGKRNRDEQQIREKFEVDRVFLEETINLKDFSKSIELPPAYISELINQKFGCTFKNLVTTYRVEEAKRLMEQAKNNDVRLIDIAYSSGFNNKVSFYRAFKSSTGKSPSEYFKMLKTASAAKI